ncbi:hypothetical protein ACFFRR_006582 [Megaselia abdita]
MSKIKSASTTNVPDDDKNTELKELGGKKEAKPIKKEQTTLMGIGIGLMATGMAGSGFHTASSSTSSVNQVTPSTTTATSTTGRHCTFAATTITIPSPVQTRRNRTQKPQPKSSLKQTTPSIVLQRPASSYSIGGRSSKDKQLSNSSSSGGGSLSSVHIIE